MTDQERRTLAAAENAIDFAHLLIEELTCYSTGVSVLGEERIADLVDSFQKYEKMFYEELGK